VAAPSATGAVLVLHDVTEMRQSDQVRRDFVANVSHELRTPLTAIRGYVDALGDEPVESAEREQFLTVIARQTGRMERLVKDLLRLASLDAREEPIENEPCALDDLLTSVVRDLSPSIDQKRQRVSVRVDPIVGPITIDVAKLQDALRNIVENASSYSSEGSRIDLSATLESRADSTWGPRPAVATPRAARISDSPWSCASPTRARAFPKATSSGSSNASTGSTRRARANRAAPGSACRSSNTWCSASRATCARPTGRKAAPCSRSGCRMCGRRPSTVDRRQLTVDS
jgi:hypothetical protein